MFLIRIRGRGGGESGSQAVESDDELYVVFAAGKMVRSTSYRLRHKRNGTQSSVLPRQYGSCTCHMKTVYARHWGFPSLPACPLPAQCPLPNCLPTYPSQHRGPPQEKVGVLLGAPASPPQVGRLEKDVSNDVVAARHSPCPYHLGIRHLYASVRPIVIKVRSSR